MPEQIPGPQDVASAVAEEQGYLYRGEGRELQREWWAAAACQEAEPELFFPISPKDTWSRDLALEFCRSCAVRDACLGVALADPALVGIWGGTDENDRQLLRTGTLARTG
ncbi:MAG: WhiB family transcriptional regulator [Actinomycetes bacterium]